MIQLRPELNPAGLLPKVRRMFELSAAKIRSIEQTWSPEKGSPVCTVDGRYASRGWTEWTQGFQFGAAILQFDATGEQRVPRDRPRANGRRDGAAREPRRGARPRVQQRQHVRQPAAADGRRQNPGKRLGAELLRAGAEGLAARCRRRAGRPRRRAAGTFTRSTARTRCSWTRSGRRGRWWWRISSDTSLMGENDKQVLPARPAVEHCLATAKYSVYYGEGRDAYDVRGRTAHESVFNRNDGNFRCPSTQQGYSPFCTWTRGLAWAMCGFAEELEFLDTLPEHASGDRRVREGGSGHLRLLHREHAAERDPVLGHRGAGPRADSATGATRHIDPYKAIEPVGLARRRRSGRRVCCGSDAG